MANINVISSFQVNNAAPADAKYLVENVAGIQAIIDAGNGYEGMQCYNQADHKLYIVYLDGETLKYKELLGNTASEIGDAQDAIDTLNGDAETEGSVANTVKVAIEDLDADVTSDDDALVNVQVVEEDGVVTDVVVANTDAATNALADIETLKGLHAKVGGEGEDKDNFKTVAEEVAEGIANLRDGADEAFDTLKEIANWINDSDANKDGFDAAQRITSLEDTVGKAASKDEDDNDVPATGLVAKVADLEAAVGEGGSVATQIAEAIEALEATEGEAEVAEGNHIAVQVVQENGVITGVNVVEDDIASAALLGTAEDEATAETAFGKIAAAQASADAAAISTVSFTTSDSDVSGSFADNTLTLVNIASATDLSTAEGKISVVEGLHAKVGGEGEDKNDFKSVAQEVADGISALNAEDVASAATVAGTAAVGGENPSAAVASTQHVQVKVTQEAGLITNVSVTEADIASKVVLDEEVARAQAAEQALADLIGTANTNPADQLSNATGLTAQVEALEKAVGEGGSVATQIADVTGTPDYIDPEDPSKGRKTLQAEIDDIETALALVNGDADQVGSIANAKQDVLDLVGFEPEEGEDAPQTVIEYVDAVADTLDGAISDLEALHAEGKTVAEEASDAIDAIAEHSEDNGDADLVKVTVTTAAGSVSSVVVDDSALDNVIGTKAVANTAEEGQPSNAVAATGLYKYIDDAVEAAANGADTAIKVLDATVDSTGGEKVSVQVVEEDGVITAVTVAEDDIASADALADLQEVVGVSALTEGEQSINARLTTAEGKVSTLEGLHAKKEDQSFKTVNEEVNEAVTALVNGAPEALDTLGEIANWIANLGTVEDKNGQVVDVASLVARVDANTTAIGVKAVPNTAEEGQPSNEVAATGLYKYVDDAVEDAANGADLAIKLLDATVDSTGGEKVSVQVVETDGVITAVTVAEDDIASAALLGTAEDTKDDDTAFGAIAKVASDLADEVTNRGTAITSAIEELDATVGEAEVAEGKHVAVQVVEEDGVITAVTVAEDDIASAEALANLKAIVGYEADELGEDDLSVAERLEVLEGDENTEGSVANAEKNAKDYTDEVIATIAQVVDDIAVTSERAVTSFTLTKKPNANKVIAYINHLVYNEDEDFTVNRDSRVVTWTATAANGGFDIDSELTDEVTFVYQVYGVVEEAPEEP